jgi:hypothetical protein
MDSQEQKIEQSQLHNSNVRLGNAGGDLIQGDGNAIVKQYFLTLPAQPQWDSRPRRILEKVQQDINQRLDFTLNDATVLIPLGMAQTHTSPKTCPSTSGSSRCFASQRCRANC